MAEDLVAHDAKLHTYTYKILKSALPVVSSYSATITVSPAPNGGSVVEWTSTFKAAPGTDTATARKTIAQIYDDGLANIRAKDAKDAKE